MTSQTSSNASSAPLQEEHQATETFILYWGIHPVVFLHSTYFTYCRDISRRSELRYY